MRALVIGYGNPYCQDDGVGFHVVNEVRRRLGLPELKPDEDGLDTLGHPVDAVMVHQLLPELVPVFARYDRVLFVDAHTGTVPEDVRIVPLKEEYGFHAVTHHLSPGMLLSLAKATNGAVPEADLISIRGDRFDFGLGLSESCRARADSAVETVLQSLERRHA